MTRLFLTWQAKESRKWYPVGQLTFDDNLYRFFYIKGAELAKEEAGFQPIVSFPDFREVYESDYLFPMFSNRVTPRSRPEYQQLIEMLYISGHENDPLAFLARSGGAKVTDNFQMFCYPQLDSECNYNLHFFAHGLRHLPESSIKRISDLKPSDRVQMAHDFQNPHERDALQLHTLDNHIVGYCPSYLLDDMNEYIKRRKSIEVLVERINAPSTPLQFRLLCRLVVPKISDYRPFSAKNYQPIVTRLGKTIEDTDVTFN